MSHAALPAETVCIGVSTLFLTRMALDINRPDTVRLLAHPEEIRAAAASAFEGSARILWRLDELRNRTWLVILSPMRPDLSEVHDRYGYLGVFPSWDTLDYSEELDEAYTGTRWHFELCASPSGTMPVPREEWLQEAYLQTWLAAEGETRGFALCSAYLTEAGWQPVGGKWMLMTRWIGTLTVTDEDLFSWAVSTGIGGGREYGAGLMTIAAAGSVWGL